MRLLLIALLLLGCTSDRDRKEKELATARQQAAEAQQKRRDAEAQAAEAQRNLDKALAEEKAAVADNEAAKQQLEELQQQSRDLIELANKKLVILKKQRDALPAGPERQALDKQIEDLAKVVRDAQPQQ